MNDILIALFMSVSATFNLPPGLLSAVCYKESHHVVSAMHPHDGKGPKATTSVGTCQIKADTARIVGFHGSERALRDPSMNIFYAGKYLRHQLDLPELNGDLRKAVAAYNTGTYYEDASGSPINQAYVKDVFRYWSEDK